MIIYQYGAIMQLPQFNPYSTAIKKYMYQIMPDKLSGDLEETIDRITASMVTKKDFERLIRMLGDVYQAGWDSAVKAAQEAMEKKNYKLVQSNQKKFP